MGKIRVTNLGLPGVKIVEPIVFGDVRGYSCESFSVRDLKQAGIMYNFVLDYQAYNAKKKTLRGIHLQNNPHPQTKLVRVLHGAIQDFVVDLRRDSPTFKQWLSEELSEQNHKQILIPNGFGHAFVTLVDDTSVLYKFDDYYDNTLVRTIRWDDPEIAIKWDMDDFIMSDGDRSALYLCDSDVNFSIRENSAEPFPVGGGNSSLVFLLLFMFFILHEIQFLISYRRA